MIPIDFQLAMGTCENSSPQMYTIFSLIEHVYRQAEKKNRERERKKGGRGRLLDRRLIVVYDCILLL